MNNSKSHAFDQSDTRTVGQRVCVYFRNDGGSDAKVRCEIDAPIHELVNLYGHIPTRDVPPQLRG
jgi:hypothetical protein